MVCWQWKRNYVLCYCLWQCHVEKTCSTLLSLLAETILYWWNMLGSIKLSEGNRLSNDARWKLYQDDAPDAWLDGEVSLLLFKASPFYTVWEKIAWKCWQLTKLLCNCAGLSFRGNGAGYFRTLIPVLALQWFQFTYLASQDRPLMKNLLTIFHCC